ncbi:hypothetical protein pdam_00003088 [Pocillopora damicornis]|uniref:Rhamnosyl O-methyltransferase n=1 Tax=Pocillopora damicornis TaxID=46731 RepID=A0A3M6T9S9_POCDA|nr:hypothetical protein pdam_00003088 [Pocillopora damicornis]
MEAAEYRPVQSAIDKEVSQKQRYARFQDRQDKSDMPTNMMLKIAHGKYWTSWRGIPVLKDCLDLIAVQELFWELKPRTVIELGAYKGGSALWAADMLKMIGVTSRVLSMDIDLSLLDPVAKAYPDVTFIQGDSLEIDKCFPPELLQELPHPWFITEDAHVNVTGVLEYFDKFTEPDDYICVEDTNPIVPNSPGQGLAKELGYTPLGSVKLDAVKLFMKDKGERYLVDQRYADFFGWVMFKRWTLEALCCSSS